MSTSGGKSQTPANNAIFGGYGNRSSTDATREARMSPSIRQIVAGKYFTVALTYDGDLDIIGYFCPRRTNTGSTSRFMDSQRTFRQGCKDVMKIAAGPRYLVYLSKDGYLLDFTFSKVPIKNSDGLDMVFVDIAAGSNVVYVLSQEGAIVKVDKHSLFGHPLVTTTISLSASGFDAASDSVIQISANDRHAAALTARGKVICWGDNSRGQSGSATRDKLVAPTAIHALDGIAIRQIACGGNFTAAVTESGELYLWGELSGPLIINNKTVNITEANAFVPLLIPLPESQRVAKVVCGLQHLMILSESGAVYRLGDNRQNQLLSATPSYFKTPTLLELKTAQGIQLNNVFCGYYHSGLFKSLSLDVQVPLKTYTRDMLKLYLLENEVASATSQKDAIFKLAGSQVSAHAFIVAAKSAVLRDSIYAAVEAKISNGASDAASIFPIEVQLPEAPALTDSMFRSLLFFMYTGKVKNFDSLHSSPRVELSTQTPAQESFKQGFREACELLGVDSSKSHNEVFSNLVLTIPSESATTEVPTREQKLAQLLADVCFELEDGTKVLTHRAILSARSEYFQKLFAFQRDSASKKVTLSSDVLVPRSYDLIELPAEVTVTLPALRFTLNYIYADLELVHSADASAVPDDLVVEVAILSHHLCEKRLFLVCTSQIIKHIRQSDKDTAFNFIELAEKYELTELLECCVNYIALNLKAFAAHKAKLSPAIQRRITVASTTL